MSKLVLVKHSLPEVRPGTPPSQWRLSPEGEARCTLLAGRLRSMAIRKVWSSTEPKALRTAELLAEGLGLQKPETIAGLHEHEREGEPFLPRDDFEAKVRRMFARPSERAFGHESADDALRRFEGALAPLTREASDNVAVVAHGTVISLYVAANCGVDGFDLWRRLGLPSYVVLEAQGLDLVVLVAAVD